MNKILIVGIGPGAYEKMTIEAARALEESDVIVGYTLYVDLVRDRFPEKEYLSTPMRKEKERCLLAFAEAEKGRTTSMICSGDAGVYGMAGLMYQLSPDFPETEIQVIPGVTAAMGGAALLGAPLTHDFCLISLSDLLTPWEQIESRLLHAAQADFVICLYNPSSKKRGDYLKKSCHLLLQYKAEDTVCGIASRIGREGEQVRLLTPKELEDTAVDMFSTVFIGNRSTKIIDGKMVTPRGYKNV